jgi:hypothetical protein
MSTAWSLVPVPVSRSACQTTRTGHHGTLTEPWNLPGASRPIHGPEHQVDDPEPQDRTNQLVGSHWQPPPLPRVRSTPRAGPCCAPRTSEGGWIGLRRGGSTSGTMDFTRTHVRLPAWLCQEPMDVPSRYPSTSRTRESWNGHRTRASQPVGSRRRQLRGRPSVAGHGRHSGRPRHRSQRRSAPRRTRRQRPCAVECRTGRARAGTGCPG